MNWNYIIIGVSTLLALVLCFFEYKRANNAFLGLRVLSVCIAVAALACVTLPVSYRSAVKNNPNEAILVTPHFDTNTWSLFKGKKVFTLDSEIYKDHKNVQLVSSVEDLLLTDSTITSLHILGDGLADSQLAQLGQMPVVFTPSKKSSGISSINWNGRVQAGSKLYIQGQYQNSFSGKLKLVLKGLNTPLDSVSLLTGNTNFELATTPKQEGRAVFHLLVIYGKDTVEKEDLPVEVSPAKPLTLRVLNSSPNFETRFLKNWLTAKGYSAVIRSAISKNKYSTEFVNMVEQPVEQLTAALLQKFDVIVGDLSAFKTLNANENALLKHQVSLKGLGLVVRVDSSGKQNSWVQAGFALQKAASKLQAPISVVIRGKKTPSVKLNSDGVYLVNKDAYQVLANDANNHTMAGSNLYGSGKIVFTALNNTYNWMLAGDEDDYSAFWSLLLSEASRKAAAEERWSVITPIPVENEKVKLQLQTSAVAKTIANGIEIAPVQNAMVPFEREAELWPNHAGWQQVNQAGKPVTWWYAWPNASWQHIKALKKQLETQLYAEKHGVNNPVTKQIQANSRIEVPKIYFYILFLAAGVFLWIESKFSE